MKNVFYLNQSGPMCFYSIHLFILANSEHEARLSAKREWTGDEIDELGEYIEELKNNWIDYHASSCVQVDMQPNGISGLLYGFVTT